MKIIDERHQVRGVAEHWKSQYRRDGQWMTGMYGDAGEVYEKLVALDPETATGKDVAKIIGNNSWAGPADCHECGEAVARTVEIGQEPDYESHTAQLCEGCLRKALALITGDPTPPTKEP